MKKANYLLTTLLLVLCLVSCKDKESQELQQNTKKGVHKIVLELEGDENISYVAGFSAGTCSLFNEKGDVLGLTHQYEGYVSKKEKKIVKTGKEGMGLWLHIIFMNEGEKHGKVKYKITTFIDEKEIEELEREIEIEDSVQFGINTLNTINNDN